MGGKEPGFAPFWNRISKNQEGYFLPEKITWLLSWQQSQTHTANFVHRRSARLNLMKLLVEFTNCVPRIHFE